MIDADALINELVNACNKDHTKTLPVWIEKQIDAQQTVTMLKEQDERIKELELEKGWDESPDMMGKW